ncbi:hypothetical protein PybrP1_002229 [[Pythium] brassicae (nom. inval.)]|nr:hypothetical protein PybrP1_002229 [[Pythium] brassicae (nom. inval.)]
MTARASRRQTLESVDAPRPLPPPPQPQARPSVRRAFPVHVRKSAESEDEGVAPQTPPRPHAHPLAALSGGGTSDDGERMPLRAHCKDARPHAKRLHPSFLNPTRVAAFLDKENADPAACGASADDAAYSGDGADAVQLLSSRVLQQRIRDVAAESAPIGATELLEDELARAATDASHWRHELHPLPLALSAATRGLARREDSALERARVRRVRKQVDPKWLQRQRDAANRPRAPLERDDERHLREALAGTSLSELVANGVLFDDDDAQRLVSFESVRLRPALPVCSSGTTGLPGCCYDSWSL